MVILALAVSPVLAKDWPEDSLKVPAKYVPKISQARAGYDSVLISLGSLRNDSTQIGQIVAQMKDSKLVPVMTPNGVTFQKAGDPKGAKAVLGQYQVLLKSYVQAIGQAKARGDGYIQTVLDLMGWKDRDRAIQVLTAGR